MFELERVVRVPTSEIALSAITHAFWDEDRLQATLVDVDGLQTVQRVDQNGRLLQKCGPYKASVAAEGVERIVSAGVVNEHHIAVGLPKRIVLCTSESDRAKHVAMDEVLQGLAADERGIVALMQHPMKATRSLVHYSIDLVEQWRLHLPNAREARYRFITVRSIALDGDKIVLTPFYESEVITIDRGTKAATRWRIEQSDAPSLDHIWKKEALSEDDRKYIRDHVRRFDWAMPIKHGLFLLSLDRISGKGRYSVLDPATGSDLRFEGMEMFHRRNTDAPGVSAIVGSYEDGLIVTVDEDHVAQDLEPSLRVLDNENPVVVLLRIRKDVWEKGPRDVK